MPDLGLVVAGDAAYNDTHLYLAESSPEGRAAWLAALDTMEALAPRVVVAGHKRAERADAPAILQETREYILAFSEVAEKTSSTLALYEQMLARYPDRVNPGALWGSARATKG